MNPSPSPGNAEPQLGTDRTATGHTTKGWYSRGYIPHCDQIGLLQSITFRLADSLPQEKLQQFKEELKSMESDAERGNAEQRNAELGLGVPGEHFWMRDYWDRYIRDESHFYSTVVYIHDNPVKAGLCTSSHDWPWSSAQLFGKQA